MAFWGIVFHIYFSLMPHSVEHTMQGKIGFEEFGQRPFWDVHCVKEDCK